MNGADMNGADMNGAGLPGVRSATPTSPLAVILAAVRAGASTAPEVVRRTGLTPDVVATGLTTLTSTGLVRPLAGSGCPTSGCGKCPVASGCASSAQQ
jgi:hypothetical protein